MRIILFICFFSLTHHSFSQTNLDSIYYYQKNNDFKKGLIYCSKLERSYSDEEINNNRQKYSRLLNWVAYYNENLSQYGQAEINYLKSIEVLKNHNEFNEDLIKIKSNLVFLYITSKQNIKAIPFFKDCKEYLKTSLGKESSLYLNLLLIIGDTYFDLKKYDEAENLFKESIIFLKDERKDANLQAAIRLIEISQLYNLSENENYIKAEKLLLFTIDVLKKSDFTENINYLFSNIFLSETYIKQGRYNEAKTILFSKKIMSINYNDNKEFYTRLHILIAETYMMKKEYSEAEKELLNVLDKVKKEFNNSSDNNYSTLITLLSEIYWKLGNFEKAEKLIREALEIEEKISGKNSHHYAGDLYTLSIILERKQKYSEAEKYLDKAIEIEKKFVNEKSTSYARYLYTSALWNIRKLNYQISLDLLLKAKAIQKENLGENHPDYLKTISGLGNLYYVFGNDEEAEKMFLESIENTNEENYNSLSNLALLYSNLNKDEKASVYFNQTFLLFQKEILDASNHLSENELNHFRVNKFTDQFVLLSFLRNHLNQYPETVAGCYENELLIKNLSLRNQNRIKISIEKSKDKILKEKYFQFTENKKRVGKLQELPIKDRPANYEQLISETENLEKDLTRLSSSFADVKKSLSITWKQIQEKLKTDEIAIDLVTFNYYNKKWTDSIVYGAFVVKKDSKSPKYVSLFEEKQLEFLLHKNKEANESDLINKQYSTKSISDLFLKPLESDLKGVKTIYLSPSGLGHQIDFNALQLTETKTFGESYKIHILGSTSELVNYKVASLDKNKNIELLLYGGIDFDKSNSFVNNETPLTDFNEMATRSGISGWNYLEGTVNEINQIATKAKQNNFKVDIKTAQEATEESIKKLDGKSTPYVLHLATHGFFFPDPKQEIRDDKLFISDEMTKAKIYKTSEDPMMRSGLLFAGANKYWKKTAEEQNTDDGILTAKEISNLDLSACELVVMSACETGLGDIKGSEGVFGLQRAFKMAGVKNIIMSLWKVPDAQTSELFDVFYEECFSGKSIHDSFKTAQSKMKAKYSPYYWAGFVLLE